MKDIKEIMQSSIAEHFKDVKSDDSQGIDLAARGIKFELRRIDNLLSNINEAARFFGDKQINEQISCMQVEDLEYYGDDIWTFAFYPNAGKYMYCNIYLHENDIHSMIRKYLKLNENITIEEILKG